jgi:hypothetical protein
MWIVRVFSVGAVLGVAGMYLEERWMTGLAIVVLLGALALRFLPGARPDAEREGLEGEE